MINLFLVRHGECTGSGTYIGRGSDVPLTAEGRKQIEKLSDFIEQITSGIDIDLLFSSKMIRAVETSEILSQNLNLSVEMLDGMEEIDFGLWEGHCFSELDGKYHNEFQQWLKDPVENAPLLGETLVELQNRVNRAANFFSEKINDGKEWNIIIVSHRGPLVLLLLRYLDLDLDHFWNFSVDRGSLSRLNLYPRFGELKFLNRIG